MSSPAVDSALLVESVFFGSAADDEADGGKLLELDFPGESVIWEEILTEDLMDGIEDGEQFVDFVLLGDGVSYDVQKDVENSNHRERVQCTLASGENGFDSLKNTLRNGGCGRNRKETPTTGTVVGGDGKPRKDGDKVAFKCGVCLLRFKIKAHLIRHMFLKHRQDAAGAGQAEKIYSRCLRCNELYSTTGELESHLREKHRTTLVCDICLRLFEDEKSLNRHRVFHVGGNPFTCDVCNKRCKNSSHLHFHRRSHFIADLGYVCPHCQKRFSSTGNRQKHIARVHSQDKRYKCPNCQESFIYPRQLKIHLNQSHTSTNRHDCLDCKCSFDSQQELAKHRSASHYQKDRPHACDQCPARFKQLGHLKTHKLTHSGQKPFGCGHCEKRFRTGSDLKVHQRAAHSREKPFRCEQCDRRFIVGYLLNQHRLKMHGGDSEMPKNASLLLRTSEK